MIDYKSEYKIEGWEKQLSFLLQDMKGKKEGLFSFLINKII